MSLFRKTTTTVDLTDEAYSRWLRARSPQPISFFLGLGESEQETLAILGDEYTQDVCLAIGFSVHDPVAAQAGLDAVESPAAEGDLLMRLAQAAARKAQASPDAARAPAATPSGLTLGGITERREGLQEDRQRAQDKGKSFLGRKPDPVGGAK